MPFAPLKQLANLGLRVGVTSRIGASDPVESQRQTLHQLLAQAQPTRIGKDYKFNRIHDYASYSTQVPLCNYETHWENYWQPEFPHISGSTWHQPISYFALSSGTSSGNTKYLPLAPAMLAANRQTALEVLAWHQQQHPGFNPFGGKILYLGGATKLTQLDKGIYCGDLSAIASRLRPRWISGWFAPPFHISDISNWQERYAQLLSYLSRPRNIQIISGVPMWIAKLLADVRARDLPGLDGLRLVIHGGTSIDPYLQQLAALLPHGCTRREVYPASEGFIAMDDGATQDWYRQRDLRLNTGKGIFFEFIPATQLSTKQPQRYWLGNADVGASYALVLTTNSGLFSYPLGDLVQLTSIQPARIRFMGRTAWHISQFGEHLEYREIATAIEQVAQKNHMKIAEWCCGVKLHQDNGHGYGRHHLIIESPHPLVEDLAQVLDAALCATNADYAHLRTTPFLPYPIQVTLVQPGAFDRLLTSMGKGGGQSKVPRIVGQPERFAQICKQLLTTKPHN